MLSDVVVDCPYCGEQFGTLVDGRAALDGDEASDYFEDCAVCCRPIRILARFDEAGALVSFDARTDAD